MKKINFLCAFFALLLTALFTLPTNANPITKNNTTHLCATDIGSHQMIATTTTTIENIATAETNIEPIENTISTNITTPVADIQYLRLNRPLFARTNSKYINSNFACNKCISNGISVHRKRYRPTSHNC